MTSDWLLNLPVSGMALIIFLATYLIAGGVYLVVTKLAVTEWARAFKAVSPGMLPPLGILFALLVGFIAVEVWNNFDKAKTAVAAEASALRAVVLLAGTLPQEQKIRLNGLINRHIEVAVNEEWPAMAQQQATLSPLPTALIGALHDVLAIKPADDIARTAQPEMVRALHTALDARRQRIVVSESSVGSVKWVGILLQGLCTLVAIAMVHSDNRRACAMTLMLFATGIALSVLLIAAYSRPFTGANSVGPQLLKQVIASERGPTAGIAPIPAEVRFRSLVTLDDLSASIPVAPNNRTRRSRVTQPDHPQPEPLPDCRRFGRDRSSEAVLSDDT